MNVSSWTPERVTQLREYAAAGKTSSEIAAELRVTRCAVLGKAHREGVKLPLTEEKRAGLASRFPNRRGVKRPPKPENWAGYRSRPKGSPAFTESERLMAVAQYMAGMSANRAARSVGAAPQTMKLFWMKDAALVKRAAGIVEQARLDAKARAEKAEDSRHRRTREVMAHNEPIIARLGSRDREIVRRKLQGENLEAIGRSLGITRERCRQILMRAVGWGIVAPPGIQLTNNRLERAA